MNAYCIYPYMELKRKVFLLQHYALCSDRIFSKFSNIIALYVVSKVCNIKRFDQNKVFRHTYTVKKFKRFSRPQPGCH